MDETNMLRVRHSPAMAASLENLDIRAGMRHELLAAANAKTQD